MAKVEKLPFGKALNPLTNKPVDVFRYTITNNNNMSVAVISRGATVQSIKCLDKHGNMADVCLGFDDLQAYIDNKTTYMGATIGRVANRVAEGKYFLDGKEIFLTKNYKDKYQIHGGFVAFDSVIWEEIKVTKNSVVLSHVNPDSQEGYPGKLTTTKTFSLDDFNNFRIYTVAVATKKTPVNITNHIYLNLAGHDARKEGLFEHNIMIKSEKIVDTDHDNLPTGCLMPVKHTPFDLRRYVNVGKRIRKFFSHPIKGFDNNYCVDTCPDKATLIAKVIHPCTGRWLEVLTNQPGVQFSTTNDFPDIDKAGVLPIVGKDKAIYAKYGAFCLDTQKYPDSMNNSSFPCVFLNPKEKYIHEAIYRFGFCY